MYCVKREKLEKIIYAEKRIGNKRIERLLDIVMTYSFIRSPEKQIKQINTHIALWKCVQKLILQNPDLFQKLPPQIVIRLRFYLILTHRYWAMYYLYTIFDL